MRNRVWGIRGGVATWCFAVLANGATGWVDDGAALATHRSERRKEEAPRWNVLLIMADDLTSRALSCYGNEVCQTPNLDRLAESGMRFTHAYCQATYCGPSRASMLSGYYPHATGVLGYESPRRALGERATWPEYFKNAGYTTTRIGKLFHMGVPGDIERGANGADDAQSWTHRINCQGPEWKAPGRGETLERNPEGTKPVMGGNTFVVVEAEGDDLVHADGKAAARACEFIRTQGDEPFWLGVGFVRPHVPFVAPAADYEPFLPYSDMVLPEKRPGDWDDIPKAGINYKTSRNMQMDVRRQRKAVGAYYASVRFVDRMVGQVLDALEETGLADRTIVLFTSDHGYHLGEHDFWAKVSLRDESSQVPLIVRVPGTKAAVCSSFVELIDLFPTTAALCGLDVPERIQGEDLRQLLVDPTAQVRDTAFCVAPMRHGFLLRDERWAYLQYGEDGARGAELFDVQADPGQFTNLVGSPEYAEQVIEFRSQLAARLAAVRDCDLHD